MADTRNWSTKTLARQLLVYLKDDSGLAADDSIAALLDSLRDSIVEEEIGANLDPWHDDE